MVGSRYSGGVNNTSLLQVSHIIIADHSVQGGSQPTTHITSVLNCNGADLGSVTPNIKLDTSQ
jgi:hypothetical protein